MTEQEVLELRDHGDMGVLEMTIPEKPNDRNQKYRKRKK